MPEKKHASIHSKVSTLIDNHNIHGAVSLLSKQDVIKSNIILANILNKTKETYKYMIHYLVEGYDDSTRSKVMSDTLASLHFINDSIFREEIAKESSDEYYAALRFQRFQRSTIQSHINAYKAAYAKDFIDAETENTGHFREACDGALSDLFMYVLTMFGSPADDYKYLYRSIVDPEEPFELKSQIISALLLGNLSYFDKRAIELLFELYKEDLPTRLTARIMTALVLILSKHKGRIVSDNDLYNRFETWNDSILAYTQLREIIMRIIQAKDTERISDKMKNEVIPEIMKLRPEIINKFKNLSETSDITEIEENPEWDEIMSKNGLGDKLKELTEMQLDGGDVMMMAFSNLKSFPFFNKIPNWFLPFSPRHHIVKNSLPSENLPLFQFTEMDGIMCDSDKYSFALSLAVMPQEQKQHMVDNMNSQINQLKEALADKKLKSPMPEFGTEVTKYVRDLYRFFKLYRKKDEFNDPFAIPLDIPSLPIVGDMMATSEILDLISSFYFKRGYYSEALPLFLKLETLNASSEIDNSLIWEKIGYCLHSIGKIAEALEWYSKAEFIHPDSKWLIKKIALCCMLSGDFAKASIYYAKSLEFSPENPHLLVNYAASLTELGKFSEALSNLYHADYITPAKPKILRAIANNELAKGDLKKSINIYQKLSETGEATFSDKIRWAIAIAMSGNIKQALQIFKITLKECNLNISEMGDRVNDELKNLKQCDDNSREVIQMILDKIRFDAE